MQNQYNVVSRADDALIDELAMDGIAYVPFFPLGGFTPLQSAELSAVAADLGATPMQTALAWLLRRAPNILLIPGTSSRAHLRENLAAARLDLPEARSPGWTRSGARHDASRPGRKSDMNPDVARCSLSSARRQASVEGSGVARDWRSPGAVVDIARRFWHPMVKGMIAIAP